MEYFARNAPWGYFSMRCQRVASRSQRTALLELVKPVGCNILEDLCAAIRPQYLYLVDTAGRTEAEVQSQIALREVAPTAPHLSKLLLFAHRHTDASIQSQSVGRAAFQIEADPVIRRIALGLQNHRRASQVFDDNIESAPIEKIAHGKPATHLRRPNRTASLRTDVLESSVALVLKDKLRFAISRAKLGVIDLRIDMPIDEDQVLPS